SDQEHSRAVLHVGVVGHVHEEAGDGSPADPVVEDRDDGLRVDLIRAGEVQLDREPFRRHRGSPSRTGAACASASRMTIACTASMKRLVSSTNSRAASASRTGPPAWRSNSGRANLPPAKRSKKRLVS